MARTFSISSVDAALAGSRTHYKRMVDEADRRLEAARIEHSRAGTASADRISQLDEAVRIFEALENEREAAACRKELHEAIQEHERNLEAADVRLLLAIRDYARTIATIGVPFEASVCAALATAERDNQA